ncbi:MAG: NAD-dependent epimerase/dehydratase family protein [Acidimicrobiia bacterium]|nr:NAD-dependent epimerase/dehydratase family protein [Acidimicrobiia bacterium]
MRAVITGATGFVGGAVLDHLKAADHEVTATVRSAAGAELVTSNGAAAIEADLSKPASLVEAFTGHDVVFHVAGVNGFCLPDPASMFAANVQGSVNVIRAALRAGVGSVVYTSSAATIGEARGEVGTEATVHRGWYLSEYERSKVEAERAVAIEAEDLGINVVSLNPASVQGPGRVTGTARLLLAFLRGRLKYLPDTRATLVDVDDCARAHVAAATQGYRGARYLLAGSTVTTREMARLLGEAAGIDAPMRTLSPRLATAAGYAVGAAFRAVGKQAPLCPEMVRTLLHGHAFDGSRAERELGFAYTPLSDTFERMVAWYRTEGLV